MLLKLSVMFSTVDCHSHARQHPELSQSRAMDSSFNYVLFDQI